MVTQEFELGYDAENRVESVTGINGTTYSASFTYDGNGQRVKSVINGETILFVGGYFEQKGSEVTKYYPGGAMRKYVIPQSMNVEYVLGDHLGSATVMTDSSGNKVSEMRYTPWGQVRYSWVDPNLSTTPAYTLPKHTFTGQYSYMDDPSTSGVTEGFGLMFYKARFYDPQVGRFSQVDSIVPGGLQGLDRYAYVGNNPVNGVDPSGHRNEDWQKKSSKGYEGCNWIRNSNCDAPEVMKKWEALRLAVLDYMKLLAGETAANPQPYIDAIESALKDFAEFLGIHIPDKDFWGMIPHLSGRGLDGNWGSDLGFNPLQDDPDGQYKDNGVYLTFDAFTDCNWNLYCVAGIMFHEAGHAWIETVFPESESGRCRCTISEADEELLMNDLATKRFGDPLGLSASYSRSITDSSVCKPDLCTDPAGYLADKYSWGGTDFAQFIWLLITSGSPPYPE
jgi:RHS repeat-associated protein